MQDRNLEHPQITRALRTGYPNPERTFHADCGCDVAVGTDEELLRGEWGGVYLLDGKYICPDCIIEKFNGMSTRRKANLLGAEFVQI